MFKVQSSKLDVQSSKLIEIEHLSAGYDGKQVLHDINLAARYADLLFAVRDGKLVASGAPSAIMTSDLVRDVFDLDAIVIPDPVSDSPLVLPRGRHHVKNRIS